MSENMDQDAPIKHKQNADTNTFSPPNGSENWIRYKLTADLIEDTHPGSGSGGVGIDALVARDCEGRPVIWASHLEGTLRNAARRLHGQEAAEAFFGRPGGQRQRFVLTSLYTTQNPICRVWRSAARASFDNRASKGDTLRAIEFVSKGTRFEGSVELRAGDIPFLRRLIAEVDAIGHGRATGAGRVKLTLSETQLAPQPVGQATSRLLGKRRIAVARRPDQAWIGEAGSGRGYPGSSVAAKREASGRAGQHTLVGGARVTAAACRPKPGKE